MITYYLVTRLGSRIASLGIGLLLAGVGAYYVLRNTFGITMPQIDWDLIWPVIVLLVGLAIVSHGLGLRATTPPQRPAEGRTAPGDGTPAA